VGSRVSLFFFFFFIVYESEIKSWLARHNSNRCLCMGQCISFLSNGVWQGDSESLAVAKSAKLEELKKSVEDAASRVSKQKEALMKMYDVDGIPLPQYQFQVGPAVIEYRAAVREYRIYSATYSEWLDLISTHRMSQITNSDHELKEIVEGQVRRSKEETERRRSRGKAGESKQSVVSEAKQAAAATVSDIHHDQESDPLLALPEASDTEMSFGAQVRQWKQEEIRRPLDNVTESAKKSKSASSSSVSSNSKKSFKAVAMPLDLSDV